MKVSVYRTSDLFREDQPCEGAKLVGEKEMRIWHIEIDTLEKLIEFINDIGYHIILGCGQGADHDMADLTLGIYDAY